VARRPEVKIYDRTPREMATADGADGLSQRRIAK
jgi:hypothetical protein